MGKRLEFQPHRPCAGGSRVFALPLSREKSFTALPVGAEEDGLHRVFPSLANGRIQDRCLRRKDAAVRYFIQVVLLMLGSLAMAGLICLVSRPYLENAGLRMGLAIIPFAGIPVFLVLRQNRAQSVPGARLDSETINFLLILGGVCFPVPFYLLDFLLIWSGVYHPVHDDSMPPELMPTWWAFHILVISAAILIAGYLTRSWTRGERWMQLRPMRVVVLSWLAYGVLMALVLGLFRRAI